MYDTCLSVFLQEDTSISCLDWSPFISIMYRKDST